MITINDEEIEFVMDHDNKTEPIINSRFTSFRTKFEKGVATFKDNMEFHGIIGSNGTL